jgi:trk system potassium uptake protein TrkA
MNAELLEFIVKADSNICDKRIVDLNFPGGAIIGGVIRDQKGIIPKGDFLIKESDRVVVCCIPKSIKKVEKLFN